MVWRGMPTVRRTRCDRLCSTLNMNDSNGEQRTLNVQCIFDVEYNVECFRATMMPSCTTSPYAKLSRLIGLSAAVQYHIYWGWSNYLSPQLVCLLHPSFSFILT
jgi:hypothetical protein